MRSSLSRLYRQFRVPFKQYTNYFIRRILKKDQDDDSFNNPFIIF
jgi:hypothetical protein